MDRNERQAFGPVIRAAREAAGLLQEDLERMTGVSRQTISAIEVGRTVGQAEKIRALLRALNLMPKQADPDVEGFVAALTPMLQRLTKPERVAVMPAIVELVAEALGRDAERRAKTDASVSTLSLPSGTPAPVEVARAAHEDEGHTIYEGQGYDDTP